MQLELPITDPVLIVALAMTIFLLAPLLFERFRVPGIIGLILAGAVVGPHGLGLLARDPTIVLLGTVGLLYLMFLAGLELDLNRFAEYRRQSLIFGGLSFSIPMLFALAAMPFLGFGLAATVLLGSIIGSHTLLAYPIVSRLGLVKNAAVTTVVGGTLVTDTAALGVLAIVAGSVAGQAGAGFWFGLLGALTLYAAAIVVGVPRLGRWFFRSAPGGAPAEFIFLMVVLFASAFLANVAGAQPIIGAFLAGLMLNRLIPLQGPLMNRVRFVGTTLFIPFFLISVGMLVDPRVLTQSAEVWVIAAALIVLVCGGKYLATLLVQRIFGYQDDERVLMFGLSVPQAAATLAVTFVGLEIGLFAEAVVNAVIMMILVTGLVGPSLAESYGRRVALREEQKPYETGDAPQRILIPIANPATSEALLDLAFVVRGRGSREPLFPLMVVREDGDRSEAQVAEAEKMLGHAVIYAAGADVPVVPLTRVDQNIARGIARGMAETRTSVVVVGWDGRDSPRHGVFGSVLDQLLEETKQLVVVAKLGHPLNTTRRIVLVLPSAIDHQPGFYGALGVIKTLAAELSADVLGLAVRGPAERYAELFERLKPKVPAAFESVSGWSELLRLLHERLEADDLVAVISARRGTAAWDPQLERLPAQLARLVPESFTMVYPSQVAPAASIDFRATGLPRALAPERVVFQLDDRPFEEVLEELIKRGFPADPSRVRRIVHALARAEREFATELAPGVVVPHARLENLRETLIFLGLSPQGVGFPRASEPARVIFVLLSPIERPDEHLSHLAEIARLVSSPDQVQQLLESRSAAELFEAFRADPEDPPGETAATRTTHDTAVGQPQR